MSKKNFDLFSLLNENSNELVKQINTFSFVDNKETKSDNLEEKKKNSYLQSLYEEYFNNKLMNRKEVVYENGQKIKDVEYRNTNNTETQNNSIENNLTCCETTSKNKSTCCCKKECDSQTYKEEIEKLKAEIDSKNKEIENLRKTVEVYMGTCKIQNDTLEELAEKFSVYKEFEEKFRIVKK